MKVAGCCITACTSVDPKFAQAGEAHVRLDCGISDTNRPLIHPEGRQSISGDCIGMCDAWCY